MTEENESRSGGKKELLFAAAAQVFAEKGFHTAKVEEIAQLAGVGKGTVYEYFSSKEKLFIEMLENGLQCFRRKYKEATAGERTATGKLAAFIDCFFEFHRQNPHVGRITGTNPGQWWPDLRSQLIAMQQTLQGDVANIINEGIRSGEFRAFDSGLAAQMFLGMVFSFGGPFFSEEWDTDKIKEEMLAILIHGMTEGPGIKKTGV